MGSSSSPSTRTSTTITSGTTQNGSSSRNDNHGPPQQQQQQQQAGTSSSSSSSSGDVDADAANKQKKSFRKLWILMGLIGLDGISSFVLLSSQFAWVRKADGEQRTDDHYTLYFGTADLFLAAALRLLACCAAVFWSYYKAEGPPPESYPFEPLHPNGDKKTKEELEFEALEEPWTRRAKRFVSRAAFGGEFLSVLTQFWCVSKSLARMNVEIGLYQDAHPTHPLFWITVLLAATLSGFEASYLDDMCTLASTYGKQQREQDGGSSSVLHRISSHLRVPLLADQQQGQEEEEQQQRQNGDVEDQNANAATTTENPADEDVRGVSDITGDSSYKAKWSDLLKTCRADLHLIALAFVFLLLAAIAQVYIPKYLGNILDALAAAFNDPRDPDAARKKSMFEIPGFLSNVKLLVLASILGGIFSGIRGSIFTVVGGRVNVRLRVQLMDSLLAQDVGFFDVTKTGEITSRLSSDTTLVGDQVSLNVNVFLRSLVQALGVLLFMFLVSWQLTILAFISVPITTVLSKWYGEYIRSLTKVMQKKLADGNSVSEAALSSMSTVRSFDAAELELRDFEKYMKQYLGLNFSAAVAYFGYCTMITSLPQLVFAVIVFYGGLLVRNGDLTSGQLVSYLLYLQSLSDAFATLGWVFSALTQAVGAADKVFELMNRKPAIKPPSTAAVASGTNAGAAASASAAICSSIPGVDATKTRSQRTLGLRPANLKGEIELRDVELFYPSRPQRRVLNGLSMKIEPGTVVALVGKSGGGKSSVMSLIQHLYEPQGGQVLLDGTAVHEISPEFLSRNVCIVSQEPVLFARSIKKNIVYGLEGTDAEPTDEEIENAARLANAHSFIDKMPQKYDTEVGERGVQLSGGQKQRIAIARALVRKPRVLLLDEATSALDAESEHLVQSAIDDMLARAAGKGGGEGGGGGGGDAGSCGGCCGNKSNSSSMTVIIVAHRLSTVRDADCIYVIQEGRVVERGDHEALLQSPGGIYKSLISRQMQAHRSLENGTSLPSSPTGSVVATDQMDQSTDATSVASSNNTKD